MQNVNALIVRLAISVPGNTSTDDELTGEVKTAHSMTGEVGKWRANRLDPDDLKGMTKTLGKVRKAHYDLTLPWEKGYRLLAASTQPRYAETVETDSCAMFWRMVDDFVNEYPAAVERMRIQLNGRFNQDDYPAASEMREMFKIGVSYQPLPSGNAFTSALAEGEVTRMREQLEQSNAIRIQAAVSSTWERVLEPLRKMAARLSEPKATFKDTLVSNVLEAVDLIPALNLTNDPGLNRAAQEIRDSIAGITPEQLRDNGQIRQRIQATAATLAEKFGQLGSRKLSTTPNQEAA